MSMVMGRAGLRVQFAFSWTQFPSLPGLEESLVGRAQEVASWPWKQKCFYLVRPCRRDPRLAPAPEVIKADRSRVMVSLLRRRPSVLQPLCHFLVILLLSPSWQPCLPSFYCFISTFVSPFSFLKPSFFIPCPRLTPPTYILLSFRSPPTIAYWFSSFVTIISPLCSLLINVLHNFPWFFYFSTSYKSLPHVYLRFTRILHTSLPMSLWGDN